MFEAFAILRRSIGRRLVTSAAGLHPTCRAAGPAYPHDAEMCPITLSSDRVHELVLPAYAGISRPAHAAGLVPCARTTLGSLMSQPPSKDANPHGVGPTPQVGRLNAQAAELLGHPAVILLQPDTVSYVDPDTGELLVSDMYEYAVRESGGQPLILPTQFAGPPALGWAAHLNLATDHMLIAFPGGQVLYDGGLPTPPNWRTKAFAAHSIVVVTGPIAGVPDIEPIIRSGRASWVRVGLTVRQ